MRRRLTAQPGRAIPKIAASPAQQAASAGVRPAHSHRGESAGDGPTGPFLRPGGPGVRESGDRKSRFCARRWRPGAAFGWSWLAGLLEDYGFEAHLVHPLRCKAIASARLRTTRAGAAILAQLLSADLLPEARGSPVGGLPAPRAGPAPDHPGPARHRPAQPDPRGRRRPRLRPLRQLPGPRRAAAGWPRRVLPAAWREIVTGCLAVTGRPGAGDRPAGRRAAPACQGRPGGSECSGRCPGPGVHRAGDADRDRRHLAVPQRPQRDTMPCVELCAVTV
jgi:hypothetical protein